MTALDDEIVPEVDSTLDEYGITASFSYASGAYDADTGAIAAGTTTHSGVIVSPPSAVSVELVGTTAGGAKEAIQSGDLEVYTKGSAALGFDPQPGWTLTIGSIAYHVVAVLPYQSGDVIAAYRIVARGT